MNIENPVAYRFIMPDQLYLLNSDKATYGVQGPTQLLEEPKPVDFKYLGEYKKNFLILTSYPDLEFIAANHLIALENILARMTLSLDDVSIFNTANYPTSSFEQLTDFFKPKKMLLLGQAAIPLGTGTLTPNKPRLVNNCNILFTFSFDEMMDNNEKKKAFWEQMKQL